MENRHFTCCFYFPCYLVTRSFSFCLYFPRAYFFEESTYMSEMYLHILATNCKRDKTSIKESFIHQRLQHSIK